MRYIRLRPRLLTETRRTRRKTCRCFDTAGCGMPRERTRSVTGCSPLPARRSMISRRRGSAIALNTSDVVAARAMVELYSHMGMCQEKILFSSPALRGALQLINIELDHFQHGLHDAL